MLLLAVEIIQKSKGSNKYVSKLIKLKLKYEKLKSEKPLKIIKID